MKKYILLLLWVSFSIGLKAENLSVDLNASSFRLDETDSRWELYYSFPENSIQYILQDDKYIGALKFSIKISSSLKTEITDEWTITHSVLQPPDSFKLKLFGLRAFKLPYGQYKADLVITDPNDISTQKKINFPIVIKKINSDRLQMSDLMLASMILPEDKAGVYANAMFWKSSLYVYPNPALEYLGTNPTLKAYVEFYNAKTLAPKGLELHYRIFDGAAREVFYYPKSIKSEHDGIAEHIEIPINALATGAYNLVLSAKAVGAPDSIHASSRFYIYNNEMPPALDINYTENLSFETSEFATLSEERLNLEFRRVRMIATKPELEQYELLSETKAKAKFMFLFWKNRFTDTLSNINKALYEHRRKIDYANTYFSYGRSDNGWDTDRGHILLKYGEPTRRDFAPHNGNERPYETWFYGEIEGGVYFYFVDVGGFGNYQLVHSTKSGEFYNDNWYELYVPVTKENRDQYKKSDDDRRYR